MGDVVTLVANTPCGAEPEGWIAVTTLYVDQDYVIDRVFWQYAYRFHERLDVSRFLDTHHVEPTQAVRIGKHLAGLVMPWLDELFALGVEAVSTRRSNIGCEEGFVLPPLGCRSQGMLGVCR